MIDRLSTTLKCFGAIAIAILIVRVDRADSTEYVFSAPPEVDNEVVEEIPAKEGDYPLYECNIETSETGETEIVDDDNNTKIDSHDCDCLDCEDAREESQTKLSSRNRHKK